MVQKSKTIGTIVKSQLKEEHAIENIVLGQTIIKEDWIWISMQKLNWSNPEYVSLGIRKISETRTLSTLFFDWPSVFSDLFIFPILIFGREILRKTSIQKTIALLFFVSIYGGAWLVFWRSVLVKVIRNLFSHYLHWIYIYLKRNLNCSRCFLGTWHVQMYFFLIKTFFCIRSYSICLIQNRVGLPFFCHLE